MILLLKIHGVPVRWQSRIEDWKENEVFVDTQVKGPYKYWHHTHRFSSMGGGTLMEDTVLYRLPLGWLGGLSLGWLVRSDLEKVFDFRRKAVEQMFGSNGHR